jgi:uncharacterized protein YggE
MNVRKWSIPLAGGLVAVALVAAVLVSATRGDDDATAQETDATRTVSVNGEGRVSMTPDIVMMSLGVDVRNEDLGAAQSEADAKMDAIITALQANGVAEADIQTGNYSIYVERDYNQQTQPIIGYVVSHTVNAKVRDISSAGDVLQAAVDAGANNVGGVWFGLEDPGAAVQQAREQAVADAQSRAEELARLTDSTLGPVQSISEGYTPASPPVPYYATGAAAEDARAAAPSINPGQTEVVVTVAVTYAIS